MTPASIRNNNPGAMEPGFASKRFGSVAYETLKWRDQNGIARENRCATFPTSVHGAAAMFTLLAEGRHYRDKPLQDAIATWCGKYWAEQYVGRLEAETGVLPSTILTRERLHDPRFAIPLVKAMAGHEGGKPYPMTDEEWQEAHRMAFGGGQLAPAPSVDNDVPFQRPEARRRERIRDWTWWSLLWGSAGTGAASVATNGIPDVPSQVTKSLQHATNWVSAGKQLPGVSNELWANMIPVGMIAAIVAGGLYLLSRRRA